MTSGMSAKGSALGAGVPESGVPPKRAPAPRAPESAGNGAGPGREAEDHDSENPEDPRRVA